MKDNENRLSDYINALNAEIEPEEHKKGSDTEEELQKLYDTVRLVRSLKEPAMPDVGYPERLVMSTANEFYKDKRTKHQKRQWLRGVAAAAAILILALTLGYTSLFNTPDYAHAMEKAFQGIKAYHGFLEITSENALGESQSQAKLEVWADKKGRYYVKQLEGAQEGVVTINNGERKWQIVPDKVYVFPAFPDAYRFSFELGKEIDQVKNALSAEVAGEEAVAGRQASIIEVKPQGGESYRIWVDKETKLPLRKQSAWNNALRYTATYTEIEFIDTIPSDLMAYKLPDGFEEVNKNPEFIVTNTEEARSITGFAVKLPDSIPEGFIHRGTAVATDENIVKLYYSTDADSEDARVVILQGKAEGEFKPVSNSLWGKINNIPVEIQSPIQAGAGVIDCGPYAGVTGLSSIRWHQEGYEFAIIGNLPMETLSRFAGSLAGGAVEIPVSPQKSFKPEVEVPVDLEIAKNDQKSVDGGSSPWQLDPVLLPRFLSALRFHLKALLVNIRLRWRT